MHAKAALKVLADDDQSLFHVLSWQLKHPVSYMLKRQTYISYIYIYI